MGLSKPADLYPIQRYAVVDVETTGFSAENDRVVEMACVMVEDSRIAETSTSLVDPGIPIPPRATAVHGITDDDVVGAPRFEIAQLHLRRMCRGATVAAHNARFDLNFLPRLATLPWICTLDLARRAFPQAPNHKNETLRRFLEIDANGFEAHRALGDALVTAQILTRCLDRLRRTFDTEAV